MTRFGDLVQTKRLILTLQQREFKVHICVDRSLTELASILFPQAVIHSLIAHGTGVKGRGIDSVLPTNIRTFAELGSIEFTEIYNLNFSPMNYAAATMFDPQKIKGHKTVNGQPVKSAWFDFAFRLAAERRCNINLVDYWAALSPEMIAADKVNPVAVPKGGGIGVVLAGRESRRSLPYKALAPLVLAARSANKCKKIFLLGSSSEREAGRRLLSEFPAAAVADTVNLAGKTDWKGLVETVGTLDRIITPDTGTMHLAAHLGVPVTGFFLSSAWCTETGPYGAGHTVIQADTDCSPCVESSPCYNSLKCLEPFRSPGMARFIATGKPEHLPDGLDLFESDCDFLGTAFSLRKGNDRTAEQRDRIRRFVACHLGILDIGEHGPFPELAEKFYREKDWITA
ncbi:glycosyltransferase family 9 protein [Maridesulfovibrio sp.]|uniref:glycosyltransferase family 9 protein n=1 Tax=Maridesulfovibrio sp. TaxID=2795000 RepID=UPI002A18D177|nr:glycosyltransferase family 9 protein [Maridesulfovibrio sp.]